MCKLNKTLYGLKQAPRASYDKLISTLLQWGFHQTKSDHSLFVLHTEKHIIITPVYVDDILITEDSGDLLEQFVKRLNAVFSLKRSWGTSLFFGD